MEPYVVVNRKKFLDVLSYASLTPKTNPKVFYNIAMNLYPDNYAIISQISQGRDILSSALMIEPFFLEIERDQVSNEVIKFIIPVQETIKTLRTFFSGVDNIMISIQKDYLLISSYPTPFLKSKLPMGTLTTEEYLGEKLVATDIGFLPLMFYPIIQFKIAGSDLRIPETDNAIFIVDGDKLFLRGISSDSSREYEKEIFGEKVIRPSEILQVMNEQYNKIKDKLSSDDRKFIEERIELYKVIAEKENELKFTAGIFYSTLKTIYELFRSKASIRLGFVMSKVNDVHAISVTFTDESFIVSQLFSVQVVEEREKGTEEMEEIEEIEEAEEQ